MSKPEQALYRNQVKPILSNIPNLCFDRIENSVGVAVPDIAFTTTNGHGWIEMKVGKLQDDETIKLDTLTAQQAHWLKLRDSMCGNTYVWIKVEERWHFLIDGQLAGGVEGITLEELAQLSRWVCTPSDRPTSDIKVQQLAAVLGA